MGEWMRWKAVLEIPAASSFFTVVAHLFREPITPMYAAGDSINAGSPSTSTSTPRVVKHEICMRSYDKFFWDVIHGDREQQVRIGIGLTGAEFRPIIGDDHPDSPAILPDATLPCRHDRHR